MLFWLQLISCSRFVNMAELHHRYDELSFSCSSDELDYSILAQERSMFQIAKCAEDPMISY